MKKITLVIAIMCFAFAGFAQSAGKIVVKEGAKYMVKTNLKSTTNVEAMGQQIEVKSDVNNKYQIDVKGVENKKITVAGTVKSLQLTSSAMGQETTFDSENPDESGPVAEQMSKILDQPQTIVMDDQGDLVETDDSLDDEIKQVISQVGLSASGPQSVFLVVPNGLKVGESFEKNKEDEESGTKSKTTFTLKSLNGDIATLSFKSDMSANTTVEQMGMEVETNMKGTGEGEVSVNIKSGVVQSSKSSTKMNGTSTVMGQDMPTSVEMTSESTVEEI